MITELFLITFGALSFAAETANNSSSPFVAVEALQRTPPREECGPRCERRESSVRTVDVKKDRSNLLFIQGAVSDIVRAVDAAVAQALPAAAASWNCEVPCNSVIEPERVILTYPTKSETNWQPGEGGQCTQAHFGKTNRVIKSLSRTFDEFESRKIKDPAKRYELCKEKIEEQVEEWIVDAVRSKVDVQLAAGGMTRFNKLCPEPCSDQTTQVYSFTEKFDQAGQVAGCEASIEIDLLCTKPRAEFSNVVVGSYRIQRSCELDR